MGYALRVEFLMEDTECCVCATRFGVDKVIMDNRRKNAGNIYCPNGHCIGWKDSDADRLRKQLEEEQSRVRLERSMRLTAEQQLVAAKKDAKRIIARLSAGVCPHCNRTFKQLAAHMKCKHGAA